MGAVPGFFVLLAQGQGGYAGLCEYRHTDMTIERERRSLAWASRCSSSDCAVGTLMLNV